MNRISKYLFLLTVVLVYGCQSEENKGSLRPLEKETIVIDVKKGHSSHENFGELVKNFEMVQLETSSESFLSEVTKAVYSDNKFYVYDARLGNLLIFDRHGKFIKGVGKRGNGPGEYVDIVDFIVDEENQNLKIMSVETRQVHIFDLEGNFKRSQRLNFQATKLAKLANDKVAYSLTYFDDDFKNMKITNEEGELLYTYFDYPKDVFPIGLYNITGQIVENYEGVLYSDYTSPYIHQVNSLGETYLKYKIDMGDEGWKEEDKYNFKKFFAQIQKGKASYLTNHYRETKNELFFKINRNVPEHAETIVDYHHVLYVKQSGKTYVFDDELSKTMTGPLGLSQEVGYISALGFDKLGLVSDSPIASSIKKQVQYEKAEQDDEQNPVLILYSF